MNQLYKIIPAIVVILSFSSCGIAQTEVVSNVEETFEGIKEIVVKGGALEVTYEGVDQATEVFLSGYLESNKRNGQEIIYRVNGNRLNVELRQNSSGGWGNMQTKGFISLTGPEDIELEVTNSSGQMFISNVVSDKINLKISSGNIEVRNLSSDQINVTASSGRMDIEGIRGNLNCKVSSGRSTISKVYGDVSVVASSGSYHISEVEGTVNGSLSSGRISLAEVGALGNLSVSSGRIEATESSLGKDTRFSGSSGSFMIQTNSNLEDYNYDLSSSSGGLEVGKISTQKALSIDNGSPITISGSISSGKISIQN